MPRKAATPSRRRKPASSRKKAAALKRAPASPLVSHWSEASAPPPDLTVSQWSDAKRILPESSGSPGARWHTDDVPALRGLMDAVNEPGVRQVAIEKAAQVGGSEAMHNILGFFIEHDPCPILFVQPTKEVAQEWSKERLADMLRTTPSLARVIREKREGRADASDNTLTLKIFPGGFLALGGANTPNTFARRSVRVAFGDDVDRWPAVVGEEGDPSDLLANRTRTFHNALVVMVSTPTLKGGRIDTLYRRSDRRRYFVRCPACGHEDWITWNGKCDDETCQAVHFRVAFDERDATTARLECPACQQQLPEPVRRAMVGEGEWRPTAKAQQAGLVGFHVPVLISTLGNVSLEQIVELWLAARAKGKESLRVFVNTALAEGWEERGVRMEPHALLPRREPYGELEDGTTIEVTAPAVVLTAGVDVQDDRCELQVMGWGPAEERWVVDARVIPGDLKLHETKAALLEALSRRYMHANGHQLPIMATCIDSGHKTDEVYAFVLAYQVRRIFATKGYAGKSGEPIVGKPSEKRTGRNPRPVRLYPINVDDAKANVMDGLTAAAPGPGYLHFPLHLDTVNEEYFSQLCAEQKQTVYGRGGVATHTIWVQKRPRNEALDTAVLALAAYRLLNPNVKQLAAALEALPTPNAAAAPELAPQPAQSSATNTRPDGRRLGQSGYLQGRR